MAGYSSLKQPRGRLFAFAPLRELYDCSEQEGVGLFAATTPAGLVELLLSYRTQRLATKKLTPKQPNSGLAYALWFDPLSWEAASSWGIRGDVAVLPQAPDKKTARGRLGCVLDSYLMAYRDGPLAAFKEQAVCARIALETGPPEAYQAELQKLRQAPIECPRPSHYVNLFRGAETAVDGGISPEMRKMMCMEIEFLLADLEGDTAGANRVGTKLAALRVYQPAFPSDFEVLKTEPARRRLGH